MFLKIINTFQRNFFLVDIYVKNYLYKYVIYAVISNQISFDINLFFKVTLVMLSASV